MASTTLKIVYKYRSTKYVQTHTKRCKREWFQLQRAAALLMMSEVGHALELPGSLIFDVALEDYVEGLGFRFDGWFTAQVSFIGDFWDDGRIIRLQQFLLKNNKKILLTQLTPTTRSVTIPPCETPSTNPTDLPPATCLTC
jgi:hypothetical protein